LVGKGMLLGRWKVDEGYRKGDYGNRRKDMLASHLEERRGSRVSAAPDPVPSQVSDKKTHSLVREYTNITQQRVRGKRNMILKASSCCLVSSFTLRPFEDVGKDLVINLFAFLVDGFRFHHRLRFWGSTITCQIRVGTANGP